jgi:hypothetical protein
MGISDDAPQRVELNNVRWEAYDSLLREAGESHVRLTYDEGHSKTMSLSFGHDNAREWIGRLI